MNRIVRLMIVGGGMAAGLVGSRLAEALDRRTAPQKKRLDHKTRPDKIRPDHGRVYLWPNAE